MADVSHELGSLRFVVDSPLSSKVAMFNNQAQQHKQSQLLNPFSTASGRVSPKPTFSKEEYGKPLAGSLTEMRGQKANIHVMKEMVELCQIINSEGYNVKDEPNMRVIPFGELFNIYNYISDKVVGILLRARKHKLVEFEGEMLFQRRDDDVPVFLLRPIQDIRHELEAKIEEIKRSTSPAPQSTSVMLDKSAHQQKLQEAGLAVPGRESKSKSRTPSPAKLQTTSIATTAVAAADTAAALEAIKVAPTTANDSTATAILAESTQAQLEPQPVPESKIISTAETAVTSNNENAAAVSAVPEVTEQQQQQCEESLFINAPIAASADNASSDVKNATDNSAVQAQPQTTEEGAKASVTVIVNADAETKIDQEQTPTVSTTAIATVEDNDKMDINNNIADTLPTIVIEASAVYDVDAHTDDATIVASEPAVPSGANTETAN